jgi:transcriptional regulator with XRE-family HTH domain
MTHLGEMLRLYRVARGNRGMRDAAAGMGLSASTLQRIEAGKGFDTGTLLTLLAWLLTPLADEER